MPVATEDRPIDKVREEVIDQLIMNYSHGQISYEAFERRLDQAMEAASNQVLVDLVADLSMTVDNAYRENKKQQFSDDSFDTGSHTYEKITNVLSSNKRRGDWRVGRDIEYTSVMSESVLDFTDAKFCYPEVRIKVFSLLTSNKIYVPENAKVIVKASCVLGSIDNDVIYHGAADGPTIIFEGHVILSSFEVEVRRTLKEKFMAFADGMKNLFS